MNYKEIMQDLECIRLMDSDVLHDFLVELYQKSRDGQSAVESFCELFLTSTKDVNGMEHPYAKHAWGRSECRGCETDTPTVTYSGGDEAEDLETCAVCSGVKP